jgi:ATP-dependent Clp protease ATP-binding subunit ClpC
MFERYTEAARRTLFFARYEASELGVRSIETEHILLGLIRDGHGFTGDLFARQRVSLDEVRRDIASRIGVRETVPTSVEIPFSEETKRVLHFSMDEADRLSHDAIGTEHLLLGLLRVDKSVAESILVNHGINLDAVRDALDRWSTGRAQHDVDPPGDED